MDEHLTTERLSRLLDEPPADDTTAAAHLEECRRCTRELEGLRRMRMALSGMGEQDPPPGEWRAVEDELRASGVLAGEADEPGRTDWSVGTGAWYSGWPARAAAAVLVFGIGLAAGLQVDLDGTPERARPVAERSATEEPASLTDDGFGGILASASDGGAVNPVEDPVVAAEQLARLDALARAVRERLQQSPADPELNDLLFRIADRQEALTREFGEAAQLVSLDYR